LNVKYLKKKYLENNFLIIKRGSVSTTNSDNVSNIKNGDLKATSVPNT